MKKAKLDIFIDISLVIFLSIFTILIVYPFLYLFAISISDPIAVGMLKVNFLPVGINFDAYKTVLTDPEILIAYKNSILYTAVGTILTVVFTSLAAYPLARKDFKARTFFTVFFIITMFFSGGMIPAYLNIQKLGLMDTLWAVVLPGCFGMWNIVLMRTNFMTIPDALIEAAKLDGANDWYILFRIVIPLSKAIVATIAMFAAVNYWNAYFSPMLYLTSPEKIPLTIILRRILVSNEVLEAGQELAQSAGVVNPIAHQGTVISLRNATIFVAIGPIVLAYPFVQKYFVKGVMVGSVKG